MAHRGGMQEVDLDVLSGPGSTAPDPPPAPPRDDRRRRRRRAWFVVVVGLVLAAAIGGQALVDHRERADRARLAEVPGILAPVDEHLEIERRPFTLQGDGGSFEQAADGSQSYAWTGAGETVLWTASLLGPTPTLASDTGATGLSACRTDQADGTPASSADQVVCLVSDGGWSEFNGGSQIFPATTTKVVVLDTGDGSQLAEWTVPAATSFALLPGLVVLEDRAGDGAVLTAHDRLTGETRWTYAEPDSRGSHESGAGAVGHAGANLLVQPNDHRLVLLDAHGEVVREIELDPGLRIAGWQPDAVLDRVVISIDGTATVRLVRNDGESGDVSLPGRLVAADVDDGSVPGLVLTRDGALHAWDASSGEARWTAELSGPSDRAIVVRGRVYVASGDVVTAYSGRSGEKLWDASTGDGRPIWEMFTDGTNILTPVDAQDPVDTDSILVAYDAVTGREAFRAPYPAGLAPAGYSGRRLVAIDPESGEYSVLG